MRLVQIKWSRKINPPNALVGINSCKSVKRQVFFNPSWPYTPYFSQHSLTRNRVHLLHWNLFIFQSVVVVSSCWSHIITTPFTFLNQKDRKVRLQIYFYFCFHFSLHLVSLVALCPSNHPRTAEKGWNFASQYRFDSSCSLRSVF